MPEPLTGKDGTFKKDGSALVVDVIGWDFEPIVAEQRFASDKTSGTKVAYAAVKDWNARVRVKVPASGTLPFNPDDTFAMELHGNTTGNDYISANGIILGAPVPCDISEGQNSEVEYQVGPQSPAIYHGLYWAGAGSSGE